MVWRKVRDNSSFTYWELSRDGVYGGNLTVSKKVKRGDDVVVWGNVGSKKFNKRFRSRTVALKYARSWMGRNK